MRKALRRPSTMALGIAALVSCLAFGLCPASATQHIVVIPGIGPGESPPPSQSAPAYSSAPARGAYGGGFIEFLVTGDSGGERPARSVAPAQPAPTYGPPPAPAYSNAYVAAPPEEFRRREVDYDGKEKPGTIIIDTPNKFLFLVEPGGRAIRYGIGVGRPGFEWSGVKAITRKAEWPDWTPPAQMLLRRPDLPRRMEGGPGNPLGARALYLGSSLYRIHGTNEPWTIGQNVSSGCIRMMNQDVIDLYDRVSFGARVIVL